MRTDDIDYIKKLSDDEFMYQAERLGYVWSSWDSFIDSNEFNDDEWAKKIIHREIKVDNVQYAKGGKTKKSQSAPRKPISIKRGRDRSSGLRRMYGFARGGKIRVESGNKGKSEVVFEGKKGERTNNKFINDEIVAEKIYETHRMKGKSVFLIVDDEVWDEYIARGDEEMYALGGSTKGAPLNTVKVIFKNPKYNYSTNVSAITTEEKAREYFCGTNV